MHAGASTNKLRQQDEPHQAVWCEHTPGWVLLVIRTDNQTAVVASRLLVHSTRVNVMFSGCIIYISYMINVCFVCIYIYICIICLYFVYTEYRYVHILVQQYVLMYRSTSSVYC